MARVTIEQLGKVFADPRGQQIHAVRDLTFALQDKEFLVLAGPSGCGKTTTLRLIAGLEHPSAGTISIDGQEVNNVPAKFRNVAMVFQNLALYPHMTAWENMAFGLQARKQPKTEIRRRIEEAAAVLAIEDCLERLPAALSGGQRQRVALGRAIVLQPRLLLLDEPLSNLDAPLRARMRTELARLHAKLGTTIIYVTHDQLEAMALGDRIAVLKEGTLQQIAAPLELYRRPANQFAAAFFGHPAMNFFRGTLLRNDNGLCFQEQTDAKPANAGFFECRPFRVQISPETAPRLSSFDGQAIVLGIRPEKIAFSNNMENGTSAKLERIEMLGAESHLHLTTASHSFIMRCSDMQNISEKYHPGNELQVRFDLQSAVFFHPDAGVAIG